MGVQTPSETYPIHKDALYTVSQYSALRHVYSDDGCLMKEQAKMLIGHLL